MKRFAVALLLTAPSLARAHGPAPAALGLHGAVDQPNHWIRTNIGLATTRPGGAYSYVCPATWDSDERFPPLAELPDGRAVVAHDGVAFIIAADGCGRAIQPLPEAGSTVAAVPFNGAVYVVTREAESSSLWRVDGQGDPSKVAHFDGLLDSVVVDGAQLRLSAARPTAELITWSDDASTAEALGWDASFIALRGGGRFVRLSTDAGVVLMEQGADGWREVTRAFTSVHGPVRFGAGWLMTVDGVVHQRDGLAGDFAPSHESRWTCLQRVGERVFACAEFGLSEVAADLSLTPVFALDDLVGVDCPDAETHALCDGQWLHFGAEAGLVRAPAEPVVEPAPAPAPPPARDDDCAAAPVGRGDGEAPAGLALVLALALRRRIATLRPTP